jgi:hypothetical protein
MPHCVLTVSNRLKGPALPTTATVRAYARPCQLLVPSITPKIDPDDLAYVRIAEVLSAMAAARVASSKSPRDFPY